MTLLVLSDVHGNLEALNSVLDDFTKKYRDITYYNSVYTLILGDTVDYGANSYECVQQILRFCHRYDFPLFTIRGNHENAVFYGSTEGINTPHGKGSVVITRNELDSFIPEIRSFCPNLIEEFLLPSNSKGSTLKVRMTHSGNPRNPLTGTPEFLIKDKKPTDQTIFKTTELNSELTINLYGHSHIPYFRKTNSQIYFNPGSVGQPRDGDPRASYGIVEENDGELTFYINRVDYDIEEASRKIKESGRAPKLYQRLFEGK